MVRRWFAGSSLRTMPVTWVENTEYHKKNGVSLLKARYAVDQPFLLLMSDHIFESHTAACLLRQPLANNETILGVDHKLDCIFDLDDALRWCAWVITSSVLARTLRFTMLSTPECLCALQQFSMRSMP